MPTPLDFACIFLVPKYWPLLFPCRGRRRWGGRGAPGRECDKPETCHEVSVVVTLGAGKCHRLSVKCCYYCPAHPDTCDPWADVTHHTMSHSVTQWRSVTSVISLCVSLNNLVTFVISCFTARIKLHLFSSPSLSPKSQIQVQNPSPKPKI